MQRCRGWDSQYPVELCEEPGVSDSSVEADLDGRVKPGKVERNCRICHLGLESTTAEFSVPIVLGCSCKDDLAAAHKQCAETWFKIRGNKTCEICGSTATNVIGCDQTDRVVLLNVRSDRTSPSAPPESHQPRQKPAGMGVGSSIFFLLARSWPSSSPGSSDLT